MRILRLIAPLVLAAAAVLGLCSSLSLAPPNGQLLYQQGAFRSLLEAETLSSEGRLKAALCRWKVCALRSHREAQFQTYDQVRQRLGLAGKSDKTNSPEGEILLSLYALYSNHFDAAASKVEQYELSRPTARRQFIYSLMAEGGDRTVWNCSSVRSPVWFFRKIPEALFAERASSLLYNVKTSEIPPAGDWVEVFPINLTIALPHCDSRLQIRTDLPSESQWFISYHNLIQWSLPANVLPAEDPRILAFEVRGAVNIDRVIRLGQFSRVRTNMVLIREYRPFTVRSL
jgi:hypothetical protein